MSDRAEAAAAPQCPYCAEPWTAGMLAALRSHSAGLSCACCAGPVRPGHALNLLALPKQDLCCDRCGKPIYRAPASARLDGGASE